VHAPPEDKSDDTKEIFHKELDDVYDEFLKCHMRILLGNLNRERIF